MILRVFVVSCICIIIFTGGFVLTANIASHATVEAVSHCRTPTPIPTPVPIWSLYSEWIPYPGTSSNGGKGWIRARDFVHVRDELVTVNKVPHLTDEEWQAIAKEHGVHYTIAGKWVYGFQPVQGFPRTWAGAVIKDEWLPERLK